MAPSPSECSQILQDFFHECISPTPLHLTSFYTLLASKFFAIIAPLSQIFVLLKLYNEIEGFSSAYASLLIIGFTFELVSFTCMKRYGILGVWTSGALLLMYMLMIALVLTRRALKWYKIRKWRKKGFVVGEGYFSEGLTMKTQEPTIASPLLSSATDTRSSILTTNTSAHSESTRYRGVTVDMNPAALQHNAEDRKSTWLFPFTSLWRKDRERTMDRDLHTSVLDEDMSETTFTVKTPQSTPGYYYQTPSRRSSPGHSFGSIYSARSPGAPSSQGILKYHNKNSGSAASSPRSSGKKSRRTPRSSSRSIHNTAHDLPIDEILQQSSFQSNMSDHFSESSELLEYDTPDEDIELDSAHRRTPSSPTMVSKMLTFDSPQSGHSKANSPSLTPIRTQVSAKRRSILKSPRTPTSLLGNLSASFTSPKSTSKRNGRSVSRRLYSGSSTLSPHIQETSFANEQKPSAGEEDSSAFATILPTLLFVAAIFLMDCVKSSSAVSSSSLFADGDTADSRFPLPWPPQSLPDILSYVFAFISNFFLFIARFPQIYHLWKTKSSEGISKMMFLCFILSNVCFSISVLLFVIDTVDILAQLPFMIGSTFTIVFDAVILILAACYSRRYDDAAFEIFSDYEDAEDEEAVDLFDVEASRAYSLN